MTASVQIEAPRAAASMAGPPPMWLCVGERGIDEAAIAREMQYHRGSDPHQLRQDAARALVVRELLALEVARLGLVVQAELGESAEEAAVRVLIDREVTAPVADASTCRRWFAQNSERLRRPDRVRVHHILLAAAVNDPARRDAARCEGAALIVALRAQPGQFAAQALRHSACPSREQGGDLGWVERGDTTPEFERQLFMLEPGLAALTLESRWGHHVVRVDAVERGAPLSYAEAAPRIAAYLEAQARQNALHQYLHLLAGRYGVRGLDAVATPGSASSPTEARGLPTW